MILWDHDSIMGIIFMRVVMLQQAPKTLVNGAEWVPLCLGACSFAPLSHDSGHPPAQHALCCCASPPALVIAQSTGIPPCMQHAPQPPPAVACSQIHMPIALVQRSKAMQLAVQPLIAHVQIMINPGFSCGGSTGPKLKMLCHRVRPDCP